MNKQKVSYFDLNLISKYRQEIMGVAILWIMVLHGSILEKVRFLDHHETLGIILRHGNVGVDIFLFLSGIGLYYSFIKESDIGIYLGKRLSRVLVPYLLIGGTYYAWWDIIHCCSFKAFIRDITLTNFVLGGNKLVWYVYGILLCYILFPYFYSIIYEKDGCYKNNAEFRTGAIVVALIVLEFMIKNYYPDFFTASEIALTRIPVFVLGIAAGRIVKNGKKLPVSFVILCFLIVFTAYPIFKGTYIVDIYQRYHYCILGIALTVVFACVFHVIRFSWFHNFFRWFGKISFELYLYHILFRNVYMKTSFYCGHVFLKYLIILVFAIVIAKFTSVGLQNFQKRPIEESEVSNSVSAAKKERIVWVDQLKAVAFIFVILGHTKISLNNFGIANDPNRVIKTLIYSFHMPLFFFVSGFILNTVKIRRQTYGAYIYKQIKHLLVPYFLLNLALFPMWILINKILTPVDNSLKSVFQGIFLSNPAHWAMPSGALWFVTVLFSALGLYILVVKCTNDNKWIQLPIMIAFALFSYHYREIDIVWHLNVVPAASVFIYCGSVFKKLWDTKVMQFIFAPHILAVPIVIAGIYVWARLSLYNGKISMTGAGYGLNQDNLFLYYFCALLGILLLIYIVKLIPSIKFLNFIGQNTLFYMAIHTPLIYLIYIFLPKQMESGPFIVGVTIALFFLIIPLAWLCRRFFPYLIAVSYEEDIWIRIARPFMWCLMSVVPIYITYQFFAPELVKTMYGKILVILTTIVLCFLLVDILTGQPEKSEEKD